MKQEPVEAIFAILRERDSKLNQDDMVEINALSAMIPIDDLPDAWASIEDRILMITTAPFYEGDVPPND